MLQPEYPVKLLEVCVTVTPWVLSTITILTDCQVILPVFVIVKVGKYAAEQFWSELYVTLKLAAEVGVMLGAVVGCAVNTGRILGLPVLYEVPCHTQQ